MTREEASYRLKKDVHQYADFSENPNEDEFWDAFDMAIQALEQEPKAGWIPVSERMPEESLNSVIGWDAYRARPVFVQCINGYFCNTGSNESFDIKAWMPLPEPYKESEEGHD